MEAALESIPHGEQSGQSGLIWMTSDFLFGSLFVSISPFSGLRSIFQN
jgi:hypothetical protein